MQWFLAALPTLGHHEAALGLCSGSPATLLIPKPQGSCLPGATSAATPRVCFGARTSIKITPTLAAAVMSPAQPQTPQIHCAYVRPSSTPPPPPCCPTSAGRWWWRLQWVCLLLPDQSSSPRVREGLAEQSCPACRRLSVASSWH